MEVSIVKPFKHIFIHEQGVDEGVVSNSFKLYNALGTPLCWCIDIDASFNELKYLKDKA